MELYAIPKDMKLIHSITNGKPNSLLRFLTDLQEHVCGIDDTRVKEEGYERAVCQANTDEATWHCKERVVYGTDSTKTKLLLIGWVADHEKEKGKLDYKKYREKACRVKDKDFEGRVHISLTDEIAKLAEKDTAKTEKVDPPERISEWEILLATVREETQEKDMEEVNMRIHDALYDHKITQAERAMIRKMPKDSILRRTIHNVQQQVDQEKANQGDQDQYTTETKQTPGSTQQKPTQADLAQTGQSLGAQAKQLSQQQAQTAQDRNLLNTARTNPATPAPEKPAVQIAQLPRKSQNDGL